MNSNEVDGANNRDVWAMGVFTFLLGFVLTKFVALEMNPIPLFIINNIFLLALCICLIFLIAPRPGSFQYVLLFFGLIATVAIGYVYTRYNIVTLSYDVGEANYKDTYTCIPFELVYRRIESKNSFQRESIYNLQHGPMSGGTNPERHGIWYGRAKNGKEYTFWFWDGESIPEDSWLQKARGSIP